MNPRTVLRLLDPDQAAGLLSSLAPLSPGAEVTVETVWAKPGRHFNVAYRIRDGGSESLASLCVLDQAEIERVLRRAKREHRMADGCERGRQAAMAAQDVLAQSFPFDYRLPRLSDCLQPRVVEQAVEGGGVDGCEVAAYRPGMRCQLRYTSHGLARCYGKTSIERDLGRRRRVHRDLCAATATLALRVPELLGSVEALGLDLVAAVGGRSLYDILAADPDTRPVVATAAALAQLHASVPAPADRIHDAGEEIELARSWTRWIGMLEPTLASQLGSVAESLSATVPATSPGTFAHRDFYDKQVLMDGGRMWLLDVDTACTGDPELDLGNFLSQIFLRGLQWSRVPEHRRLETAAEEAYGASARPEVTRWYRRTSLLRLACVYQLRPGWRHVVPALLDEAAQP